MRASSLPGVLVLGLIAVLAPANGYAQATNPDYTYMVLRYMTTPTLGAVLGGEAVPARILALNVPDTIEAGEPAVFAVDANIETADLPIRATWQFGDGVSANGLVAQHAYREAGQYEVRVSVANAVGSASRRHRVTVIPPRQKAE
ncbi:MAG TPA: PKD domain-containing protein [Rhodothermales bacterium]